jgi:hypothetical protein
MPSQAALPQATLASGVLTLTYLQNDFASDLAFTVQVSSDLVNWSSGTGATTAPVTLSDNGLVRTLQVSDANPPASGAPRFIRLQVSGE